MMDKRSESLSEQLFLIDADILEGAYDIDDRDKLMKYAEAKNKKMKKSSAAIHAARRIAVSAACIAIMIGVAIAIAVFTQPSNGTMHSNNVGTLPPWIMDDAAGDDIESYISIRSIDMLNYYTAIRMLNDPSAKIEATNVNGITVLTARSDSARTYNLIFDTDTNNGVGYDSPPEGQENGTPGSGTTNNKIIHYELDPNEVFSVSCVVCFQIEIKSSDGFLASKVGTGIVDVFITENSLEPMITFKNQDRYYSCCENSQIENGKLYSTHKYIEGFYIVKNLEQDNYSISVTYDNFNPSFSYMQSVATSIVCNSYKNGGDDPDGELPIVSDTYVSSQSAEFTVADLEEYFNTGKLPSNPNSGSVDPTPPDENGQYTESFYTDGIFEFILRSDGTFIYSAVNSDGQMYRKGTYTWGCDYIQLDFYYDENITESTSCDLIGPDSFMYDGTIFTLVKEGGDM